MQINVVRARLFYTKVSIFTHFFGISAQLIEKKVVILQRELISGNAGLCVRRVRIYRITH